MALDQVAREAGDGVGARVRLQALPARARGHGGGQPLALGSGGGDRRQPREHVLGRRAAGQRRAQVGEQQPLAHEPVHQALGPLQRDAVLARQRRRDVGERRRLRARQGQGAQHRRAGADRHLHRLALAREALGQDGAARPHRDHRVRPHRERAGDLDAPLEHVHEGHEQAHVEPRPNHVPVGQRELGALAPARQRDPGVQAVGRGPGRHAQQVAQRRQAGAGARGAGAGQVARQRRRGHGQRPPHARVVDRRRAVGELAPPLHRQQRRAHEDPVQGLVPGLGGGHRRGTLGRRPQGRTRWLSPNSCQR